MPASSSGVWRVPSASTQKIVEVGASSTRAVGPHQQRLVGAVALGDAAWRVMLRLVGEGLEARSARSSAGTRRSTASARARTRAAARRSRSAGRRAMRTSRSPPSGWRCASSSAAISRSNAARSHSRKMPSRRAVEPVQVVGQRERAPVVEPQHLERAVATQEAVVGDRDGRLGDRADAAVDGAEQGSGAEPDTKRRAYSTAASASAWLRKAWKRHSFPSRTRTTQPGLLLDLDAARAAGVVDLARAPPPCRPARRTSRISASQRSNASLTDACQA